MDLLRKRLIIFSVITICSLVVAYFYLRKKQHNITEAITSSKDSIISTTLFSEFYDLENNTDASISNEKALSGKQSSKLSAIIEYGTSAYKIIKDIPCFQNILNINVEFNCYASKPLTDAVWVLSIDDAGGKNVFWEGKPIVCDQKDKWKAVTLLYDFKPEFFKPEYSLKLYPWNKNKEEFYVDDILIKYNGIAPVTGNEQLSKLNSNYFFDFENKSDLISSENIKTVTKPHSGKMAYDLSAGDEYGPSVIKKVNEVTATLLKKISASVWVYSLKDNPNVVLTASAVNSKNETVFWDGKSSENKNFPQNQWTKINALFSVPFEKINPEDKISVSFWNKGKDAVIIDDLEIVYGEHERKGVPSSQDPLIIAENGFVPPKNTPPFKTHFFQKQEINTENGTFLINSNNNKIGDFSPNDEFLVGNFLQEKKGVDEIICVQSNEFGLYGFSSDNNQFQCYLQNRISDEVSLWKNSKKLVGDFNGNGTDNVFLINTNKKEMHLISFAGTLENQSSASTVWKTTIFKLENTTITENNLFFSGDFNRDKKEDLLLIDPQNGNWTMFNFKNNNWESIASGNSAFLTQKNQDTKTSKQVAGKFYANKNQDVLLVSYLKNEKNSYKCLEYNSKNKHFEEKEISSENSAEAFFKNTDEVLVGNFDNDSEQEFLKLNTDWRFDLKQVDLDANGFNISYMIDFKGYPKDHNPKYYEFVKIISGNFSNKDQTSLLVMMRNCSDADFNGKACKQFENLPYLPNSTQLYNANTQK